MSLEDVEADLQPCVSDMEFRGAFENFRVPTVAGATSGEPATQQQIEGLQQWVIASVDELLQHYATQQRAGDHVVADMIRQIDQKLAGVDGSVKKLQEDMQVQERCLDHVTRRVDELRLPGRVDLRQRLGLSSVPDLDDELEEETVTHRLKEIQEARLRSVELAIEDRDLAIQNTERRLELTDSRLASFESSCRDLQSSGAAAGRDEALRVVHSMEETFQKDIQSIHARCDALRELVNESVVVQVQSLERKVNDHSTKVDQLLSRLGDQIRNFQVWGAVQATLEQEVAKANTKIEQLLRRDRDELWEKKFKEFADDLADLRSHFNGDALMKFRANWGAPQRPC